MSAPRRSELTELRMFLDRWVDHAKLTRAALAARLGCKPNTVSGWEARQQFPADRYEQFRDINPTALATALGEPPDARPSWEYFATKLGVKNTNASQTRGNASAAAPARRRLSGAFADRMDQLNRWNPRTADAGEMRQVLSQMGGGQFLVVFAGSVLPLVYSDREKQASYAAEAVAGGAKLLVVGPNQAKFDRWHRRGFRQLKEPAEYEGGHKDFVGLCGVTMAERGDFPTPEAAMPAVRERTCLVQTDECEHVRLSVAFSVFGQRGEGLETRLWAGVRYADESRGQPEATNFRWRMLVPDSYSERRVIESAAFVVRDRLGVHTAAGEGLAASMRARAALIGRMKGREADEQEIAEQLVRLRDEQKEEKHHAAMVEFFRAMRPAFLEKLFDYEDDSDAAGTA